jgi:hypothetical protein
MKTSKSDYRISRRDFAGSLTAAAAVLGLPAGAVAAAAEASQSGAKDHASISCDVCVVGVGSGGFGAALAAARAGANVVAVERNQIVGGTSTMSWVHVWQPVSGARGIPQELWQRMSAIPGAAPKLPYEKAEPGWNDKSGKGGIELPYEPWAYDWCAQAMLRETGRCRLLLGASLAGVDVRRGRIQSVSVRTAGEELTIRAKQFIDGTGDGVLCAAAGCPWNAGQDARSAYGESLAPEKPERKFNAMTLIYRLSNTKVKQEPQLPPGIPPNYCEEGAYLCTMPNGDTLVNRCGMLTGDPLDPQAFAALLVEARRRVHAHAYWMQTKDVNNSHAHQGWSLSAIAPQLGVRESRRIVGDYVLTENDFRQGLAGQKHSDIIAISDHTLDLHGRFDLALKNGPRGVPFRCLLPKQVENLLIACRALSCSQIAASSVRLQRTIMKIGEAAGIAAAMAVKKNVGPRQVPIKQLQAAIGIEQTIEKALR